MKTATRLAKLNTAHEGTTLRARFVAALTRALTRPAKRTRNGIAFHAVARRHGGPVSQW